jgi:hypothetical protein
MEYSHCGYKDDISEYVNLEEEDIELYIYRDNSFHCYIFKYCMAVRKYSIVVFICISLLLLIIM